MHNEIGAFDGREMLSDLLLQVRAGKRFTITLDGEPIADLVPHARHSQAARTAAVMAMQQVSKIQGVSDAEVESWIAEGRR